MIDRESLRQRKLTVRTIYAAIAMLAGVILMGFGYFQNERVMIYAGVAITATGVMTEAVFGIIGSARERRRRRMAGV